MRRATEAERAQLAETFAELCRIPSPSGNERACADWVAAELRRLGLDVHEDGAGTQAEANAGNLLVRIGGAADRSVMLCAHLDTVPPVGPIEPAILDGGWINTGPGILGADNKAAVAVILQVARRLAAGPAPPPVGLEALFTVSEENGLRGAHAFDVSALRSEYGFVFDHASPIGEIILAAPSYHRIIAHFHGRAAHAGLHPERGRSAILAAARAIAAVPHGRLDGETTVNVGTISGGTAANVVAERCDLEAEVRSIDGARAEALVTEVVDHLSDAAGSVECDLDVELRRMFAGYRTRTSAPQVRAAEAALRACGYEPRPVVSGGGSDVNALLVSGFPCVNLANGTEHAHEPEERVSVEALDGMLEVALSLVDDIPAGA